MEAVLQAAAVYLFLLLAFRIAGRRSLAETTTFDLVLVLIVSEAVQQAMVGDDPSLTRAMLVVLTLIGLDIGLSLAKQRWPGLDRWIEGVPTLLVDRGRPLPGLMRRSRVDESDILEAARRLRGLATLDEVEFAILERGGAITIIPRRPAAGPPRAVEAPAPTPEPPPTPPPGPPLSTPGGMPIATTPRSNRRRRGAAS